jgi:hypothetical protein
VEHSNPARNSLLNGVFVAPWVSSGILTCFGYVGSTAPELVRLADTAEDGGVSAMVSSTNPQPRLAFSG